jgi:hypothetical protein
VRTTFGGYPQIMHLELLCNSPKWDAPHTAGAFQLGGRLAFRERAIDASRYGKLTRPFPECWFMCINHCCPQPEIHPHTAGVSQLGGTVKTGIYQREVASATRNNMLSRCTRWVPGLLADSGGIYSCSPYAPRNGDTPPIPLEICLLVRPML